jgi:hypothetical protein
MVSSTTGTSSRTRVIRAASRRPVPTKIATRVTLKLIQTAARVARNAALSRSARPRA